MSSPRNIQILFPSPLFPAAQSHLFRYSFSVVECPKSTHTIAKESPPHCTHCMPSAQGWLPSPQSRILLLITSFPREITNFTKNEGITNVFCNCGTRNHGKGLTASEVWLQKRRMRSMKELLDWRGISRWSWGSGHYALPLSLFAQKITVAVPAHYSKEVESSVKVFEGTLQKESECGWGLEIGPIQAWILLWFCSGTPDAF